MASFSDLLANGPKMFEEHLGPKWGPRLWRAFFIVGVLAITAAGLSEIGGFGKGLFSTISGLFSPSSTGPAPPGQMSSQPSNCMISGGTNYGNLKQTCK
jgi:hypothetical protein